jgi:hypothetical protein
LHKEHLCRGHIFQAKIRLSAINREMQLARGTLILIRSCAGSVPPLPASRRPIRTSRCPRHDPAGRSGSLPAGRCHSWTTPPPLGGLRNNFSASGNGDLVDFLTGLLPRNPTPPEPLQQIADSIPERRLGRSTSSVSPASVFDTGAPAVPLVLSGGANYSGGLLGMFAALAGGDPNQPASPDDEHEQANLQALEERLTSTGNINDAWALYKARIASRR